MSERRGHGEKQNTLSNLHDPEHLLCSRQQRTPTRRVARYTGLDSGTMTEMPPKRLPCGTKDLCARDRAWTIADMPDFRKESVPPEVDPCWSWVFFCIELRQYGAGAIDPCWGVLY